MTTAGLGNVGIEPLKIVLQQLANKPDVAARFWLADLVKDPPARATLTKSATC